MPNGDASKRGLLERLDSVCRRSLGIIARACIALPYSTQVIIGLLMLAGAVFFDRMTGYELSVSFFYLPPILLVTWGAGHRWGILCAAIAAISERVLLAPPEIPPEILTWNCIVRFMSFGVVVAILSLLKKQLELERKLARIDYLTGLPNGHAFFASAEAAFLRARREGLPLTVAFLDCDNLKEINDTEGHARGDELLRAMARGLREGLRGSDDAARLGGDEFAAILSDCDHDRATSVLERIVEALRESLNASRFSNSFSIGAVVYPEVPESVAEALRQADHVMYSVKREGKGATRVVMAIDLLDTPLAHSFQGIRAPV